MKIMKKLIIFLAFSFFALTACSLNEELNDKITKENSNALLGPDEALASAYRQLRSFQTFDFQFSLQEHSSDEMAGPTRGNDWNDNGKWRALHLHNWTSENDIIVTSWRELYKGLAFALDAQTYPLSNSQKAQAIFIESFYIFEITDLFGQVSLRKPGEDGRTLPSIQLNRTNAIDHAIEKLEAILPDLPDGTALTSDIANKNAGNALLAKMYLNKAVYKATDPDGKPQSTITFSNDDLTKVINYADAAMSGRSLTMGSNFYDNFSPTNGETSSELIFTSKNTNSAAGDVYKMYRMTLHYNQNPSGWNGFVALTDLYNKFTPNDVRFSGTREGLTNISGLKTGILIGQQYDQKGTSLISDGNNPLIFTPEFSLTNSSKSNGLRVIKYIPDYSNLDQPNNDWVFIRVADVMLMKAEATARMGNTVEAMTIINDIRSHRNAPLLTALTINTILDERARELYWEGHRRRDQIRFGTFLNPVQERSTTSDRHVMIFPIPLDDLSVNPNLHQNPGY
jgi:hypothetical protein